MGLGSIVLAQVQRDAGQIGQDQPARAEQAVPIAQRETRLQVLAGGGELLPIQLQGTDASLMRVVHRFENGVSTERITALDDVGREIIRRYSHNTRIQGAGS